MVPDPPQEPQPAPADMAAQPAADPAAQAVDPAAAKKPDEPHGLIERAISVGVPALVMLAVVGSWVVSANPGLFRSTTHALEVVTSATRETTPRSWRISGRVLRRADGRPVAARVWAIAVDSIGNRFSPPHTFADSLGQFTLAQVPLWLVGDSNRLATDLTVHAAATQLPDTTLLTGRENIRLMQFGRVRWSTPSLAALLSIAVIFALTLIVGLWQPKADDSKQAKYAMLAGLVFTFTLTVIVVIAVALRNVNANSTPGDVISLGFANVYRGSYVKTVGPEWLFSLTAPTVWKVGEVTRGFGVPLWLLFVAALGTGLYTLSLLVKHAEGEKPADEKTYRSRAGELVRHQFYMLFTPLGAILVYQLMVAADAANQPVVVAFAVFAAGVVANAVLDRAVKAAQSVLAGGP